MLDRFRNFAREYTHAIVLLYFIVYLIWFSVLEAHVHTRFIVGSWFDNVIPFEEIFIIPYMFWFVFIGWTLVYLMYRSREDFLRLCMFMFTGMTICLIAYTFFPNGQALRPIAFERDNIFVYFVQIIYSLDTPTDVCPSIHVLNSIGACIAVLRSDLFRQKRNIRVGAVVAAVLISASTVFIKQHSVIDGLVSCIISIPLYFAAYRINWKFFAPEACDRMRLKILDFMRISVKTEQ